MTKLLRIKRQSLNSSETHSCKRPTKGLTFAKSHMDMDSSRNLFSKIINIFY